MNTNKLTAAFAFNTSFAPTMNTNHMDLTQRMIFLRMAYVSKAMEFVEANESNDENVAQQKFEDMTRCAGECNTIEKGLQD